MTNIMLALLIITSADPKGTRARLEGKFDTILESDKQVELYEALRSKGLVEYGSMNAEQREAVLHELTEKFDNYKVKSNKLTDEEKANFIKDICNQETEDEMIQRLKIGVFTPDDMIKAGISRGSYT